MEVFINPLSHPTLNLFVKLCCLYLLNISQIQSHLTTATHYGPNHHPLPGLPSYSPNRPLCFLSYMQHFSIKYHHSFPQNPHVVPHSLRRQVQVLITLYKTLHSSCDLFLFYSSLCHPPRQPQWPLGRSLNRPEDSCSSCVLYLQSHSLISGCLTPPSSSFHRSPLTLPTMSAQLLT